MKKISNPITDLTTTNEGNALIMRKGKTTLFSAKVMLLALLKIENRNDKIYSKSESKYYQNLYKNSMVDYTKGLVSEIDVSELKTILGKKRSGSFYATLKELFSIDPHEEKSLRNSWAIMMPNNNSGVLGYAEVITACHYDTNCGKLFLKFSDEEFVKSQLWQIKSDYTSLPVVLLCSFNSIFGYRLYEIIYSELTKLDNSLKEKGETVMPTEYSFRYPVGELQLMMGIMDITRDRQGMQSLSKNNPDYNAIAQDINSRQHENMGEYRSFRRYSLDVATNEINSKENAAFTITYSVEKDEHTRRVAYIIFHVQKKVKDTDSIVYTSGREPSPQDIGEFMDTISNELSSLSLTYLDLKEIAKISNCDSGLVLAAYQLYIQLSLQENFVEWFRKLTK